MVFVPYLVLLFKEEGLHAEPCVVELNCRFIMKSIDMAFLANSYTRFVAHLIPYSEAMVFQKFLNVAWLNQGLSYITKKITYIDSLDFRLCTS